MNRLLDAITAYLSQKDPPPNLVVQVPGELESAALELGFKKHGQSFFSISLPAAKKVYDEKVSHKTLYEEHWATEAERRLKNVRGQ